MTFAAVEARTNQVALVLRAAGVDAGDRVALMLPNGLEFPICWLAIAKLGAVMVPLNVQYRSHDLAYTLGDAGASLLLVDPTLADVARSAAAQCPSLRQSFTVAAGTLGMDPIDAFGATVHAASTEFDLPPVQPTDLLNLQYTSGTTGPPKGCMLTHEYWLRLAELSAWFAQLHEHDVVLTAQPFYYMDPQWNVAMCLLVGCPLVILPRFSASTFWDSVQASGATFVYMLGTMPVFLLKQPARPEVERAHRLRFVACSGIVPQLHATFEERWGVPWREAFGMTETGVDLVVTLDETDSVGSGAAGRPVPGKEARVIAPDGRSLDDGEIGELCIRGATMMRGYWNNPVATADRLHDGWMHTGDLAFRDDVGRYHIVGRLKDVIRRTGENISASEVEGVLCQHPAVCAAAVVPVPDELRGEEVKAFVQLRPEHESADPQAILDFVRAHLAPFKVPRFIEFVTDFPRTPSERVAKHVLLAREHDPDRRIYDSTTGSWT